MKKLTICKIKEDYIEYMNKFDSKVYYNKGEGRPYIGILFEINNFKYYAPLSSPKEKHQNMPENIKYVKIQNGEFGLLNLSNMIPVLDDVIINFDIRTSTNKNIYFSQLRYLKKYFEKIQKNAEKLYNLVNKGNRNLTKHCCNYKLLEDKQKEYESL